MSWVPLPVGVENFEDLRRNGYYYVDKTLFIKELIDMKVARAHERGIEVYLFTRTAWKGYTRNILGSDVVQWMQEIDRMRQDINTWIKSDANPADGYIDLDFMCTDETVTELKREFTTDGVHFTELGQQAVVNAVPLGYFQ